MKTPSILSLVCRQGSFIDLFRSGDEHTFKSVYDDQYMQVYFYVKKMIGNQLEAEEITAQTFLKLWVNKDKMETIGHIHAFIRRTAYNAGIDYFKHKEVKTKAFLEIGYLLEGEEPDDSMLETLFIKGEMVAMVNRGLNNLPPRIRQIVQLYYFEGHSTEETARQLGLTESTVRVQLMNAHINLRKQFGLILEGERKAKIKQKIAQDLAQEMTNREK